jgi:hypothetical protein
MSTKGPDKKKSEHAHDKVSLPDLDEELPPLDFTTFLLSLSTSAMSSLGELAEADGSRSVDLPLARQTIDLLGLLHDKTQGNLTGEEERLLEQVLLDLRLKFVSVAGQKKSR